jgi:endogenous inhibitor of DNA gyrase (YacG/DUF329 family)
MTPSPKGGTCCPICRAPAGPQHRPFCSARCADVDLGRWLTGRYAVPTDEPTSEVGVDLPPNAERP